MFQKAQKDWFIALRTRWTLSNQQFWNRTHKVGGTLFKIAGIAAIGGALLPPVYGRFLVVAPMSFVTVGLIAYAHLFAGAGYRKHMKPS